MTPLALAAVAAAVGGRLDLPGGEDADGMVVRGVALDSRRATAGDLFLAVPGERVDGHDFAGAAVAAGAVAVLATRPVGVPAVLVDDVPAALGRLAADQLARLPQAVVVGITGSSGKTTTKDLVAALLRRLGPTVAPPGSFNNELGLPLTVLQADEATRHLVLEFGARGIGHLRALSAVARPDVSVVLNVGSAHVGEFGSRENIAVAKGELVEALLPREGRPAVAVLNADDPLVLGMRPRVPAGARVVLQGEAGGPEPLDVAASGVELDVWGRARFLLHHRGSSAAVSLRLVGEHMVGDALAAAAVALELGLSLDAVAEVLSAAEPASPHRMAVTERADGVTVIDDSYNANPESVRAALKALAAVTRAPGRRGIAVLGEMLELGDEAAERHDELGRLAVRLDVGKVVSVGDPSGPVGRLHAGATLEGSWGDEAVHVHDVDEALALLRAELRPGDVVLVKASRAAGLDRVADALVADAPPAAPAAPAGEGAGA